MSAVVSVVGVDRRGRRSLAADRRGTASVPAVSRQQGPHMVLGAFGRLVLRVSEHWKVDPAALLGDAGIAADDLDAPFARIPLDSLLRLIERARALTGEPGLGWYSGLQAPISMYGYLGFGLLSAATLREALELLVAYGPLMGSALTLRLEAEGDGGAWLVIEENADLGLARDFVLGGFLVATWSIGSRICGSASTGSAELMIAEPDYFGRITGRPAPFGGEGEPFALSLRPVRFGQARNRIFIDRARLDQRLPMADGPANRMARTQCEVALEALADAFVDRVRRCLSAGERTRCLPEVACELRMSARTLKRKLGVHGVTFRALVEQVRRDRALLLLRSGVPISEIAARLGYSTQTNFGRAFRSWTSLPPGAYRRRDSGRYLLGDVVAPDPKGPRDEHDLQR